MSTTRRTFLNLGTGMLAVGLGSRLLSGAGAGASLARRRGSGRAWDQSLDFGELESLVTLIQELPPAQLQAKLVAMIGAGTSLRTIVAATALATARTFGGEDYIGYHCMMALTPAYQMSELLPGNERPLPVLKVVYRSAGRIQAYGGRKDEVLKPVAPLPAAPREELRADLRSAFLARDLEGAERAFAALAQAGPQEAYDDLQAILHENLDVHRVVLAWRAWEALPLTGEQHAHTLLRQTLRFCVEAEEDRVRRGRGEPRLRTLLPELLEQHELETREAGGREASKRELQELADVLFGADKEQAAHAMAQALASGMSERDAGEAMSVAANRLLLFDPGRTSAQGDRPVGSVHGASVGVHASDAALAWRHIAMVSNRRNAASCLIAGAYHTAGQSPYVGSSEFPYREHVEPLAGKSGATILECARAAIEDGDQRRAAASAAAYRDCGEGTRPLFDLLLRYAVSEDGALHAEKYFHTACEDFAASRPENRWNHAIALARVTASEKGWPAPGLQEARAALGV